MSARQDYEGFIAGLIAFGGCALPMVILIFGVALIPIAIVVALFRMAFGH